MTRNNARDTPQAGSANALAPPLDVNGNSVLKGPSVCLVVAAAYLILATPFL